MSLVLTIITQQNPFEIPFRRIFHRAMGGLTIWFIFDFALSILIVATLSSLSTIQEDLATIVEDRVLPRFHGHI